MKKRLSRFGVGPKIMLSAIAYAALAAGMTNAWPEACVVAFVPRVVFQAAGEILLLLGIPMWLAAVVSVMRAYNGDQLRTSGVFGLCRHPVYAAWIVLLLPGITLLSRSWPLMLTPLVAYAVFKLLIHVEDEYLEARFGAGYRAYRARVRELVPIPKG